jgi:hypothetical protein
MSGFSKAVWVLSAILAACAPSGRILPRNESNEPVFYKTHYFSFGNAVSAARLREKGDDDSLSLRYFHPIVLGYINMGPWASFFALPVFWNFLLTGEQYADSRSLQSGKLHVALHGGLTGLGFSSRRGWMADERIGLAGKYLFGPRLFWSQALLADWHQSQGRDSLAGENLSNVVLAGQLGRQFTDGLSSSLLYSMSYYHDKDHIANNRAGGLGMRSETFLHELGWRSSWYWTPRNVLGFSASFGTPSPVDWSRSVESYSFSYRYVF